MKLWKRMALWSLLLFIVIFNISGLAIIESSHASELRGELGRVLEQQQALSSGIGVLLQNGIAGTESMELQILRRSISYRDLGCDAAGNEWFRYLAGAEK